MDMTKEEFQELKKIIHQSISEEFQQNYAGDKIMNLPEKQKDKFYFIVGIVGAALSRIEKKITG